MILSRSLTTHDVRLMERYEATSLADLPALRIGMMVAILHILGQSARSNDELKMESSSVSALLPRALRNVGGMLSGPAAPFFLMREIAAFNSVIRRSEQLTSASGGWSIRFLNCRTRSRSVADKLRLFTLA